MRLLCSGYFQWSRVRNFNPDYPGGLFCRTNQVHQVLKFPKLSLVWNICYSQQDLLLRWCFFLAEFIGKWNSWKKIERLLLLMDKILHHQGWWLSHYLQGFNHPRWCRILSINSITLLKSTALRLRTGSSGCKVLSASGMPPRAEGWKLGGHGGNLLDPLPCFFSDKACHVVHLNSILAKTYDNTNNQNHVILHCQKHKKPHDGNIAPLGRIWLRSSPPEALTWMHVIAIPKKHRPTAKSNLHLHFCVAPYRYLT